MDTGTIITLIVLAAILIAAVAFLGRGAKEHAGFSDERLREHAVSATAEVAPVHTRRFDRDSVAHTDQRV